MEISPAKRVGRILELLRNESGKTQAEVAREAHCDHTFISHIERGNKGAHIDTVRAIGKAVGHEKVVTELWGFVGAPETAATADLLAGYEAEAEQISVWTTTMVHALMQTESYMRALFHIGLPFASDGEIEKLVSSRLDRQQGIMRDNPPLAWTIIDESILYRAYGGREVMAEQLSHIEELATRPNFVVQVMPFTSANHPGFEGSLGIVEFSDKTPIWYSDAWSAGKLSDDQGEVPKYKRFFSRISADALSPVDSIKLIAQARRERHEQ
jgi:transcriptional regulator with XRE-family HTH domain